MSTTDPKFNAACVAYHEGKINFSAFVAETKRVWRTIAARLLSKWRAPMGDEDVIQELLLAAWSFFPKYDPAKGATLHAYIVFNACDKAKKNIHKVREANRDGNADSNPSRLPANFSDFLSREENSNEGGTATRVAVAMVTPATQDRVATWIFLIRMAANPRDRVVLSALKEANGDTDVAAQLLYGCTEARSALRLGSLDVARARVKSTLLNLKAALRRHKENDDEQLEDFSSGPKDHRGAVDPPNASVDSGAERSRSSGEAGGVLRSEYEPSRPARVRILWGRFPRRRRTVSLLRYGCTGSNHQKLSSRGERDHA